LIDGAYMSDESEGVGDTKNQYAELKKELIEIASILEKFPDSLKANVFQVLVSAYHGNPYLELDEPKVPSDEPKEEKASDSQDESKGRDKSRKRASPDSYSIDPDLNLHGENCAKSFQVLCGEKKPSSSAEFNTVAVYYITKILKKPKATVSQVWTCYKDMRRRTPDYFKQSLTDTKNKTGNIKISDDFELELSDRGENFVEHDLPAKPE
jgi:hypothetical protein